MSTSMSEETHIVRSEECLCVLAEVKGRHPEPDVWWPEKPMTVKYTFMREEDWTPWHGITLEDEPGAYHVGETYLVSWEANLIERTTTSWDTTILHVDPDPC